MNSQKDKKRNCGNSIFTAAATVYTCVVSAAPAYASTADTVSSAVSSGANQIWNILVSIVGPIAAVALAVCALKMVFGGQKATEEAKSNAIKIVIAIAIVMLAPSIISAVRSWFTASGWSF